MAKGGNTPAARALIRQLAQEQLEREKQQQQEEEEQERQELATLTKDSNALSQDYPVADCLWQGVFGEIADRVGERSWPVWLGTYTALMARIERKLQFDYWGSLVCAMPYSLMIGYSGSNKGLAARICRELMPPEYRIRKAVSSGPGLLEILKAEQEGGENEEPIRNPIPSQPAMLVIEEWTGLLKYAGLSGSVLFEDLCDLYHTRYNFNVTTKKRKGEGGDQDLERPTLSILGTTTPGGFAKAVTRSMIEYGFINRHLILPCKTEKPLRPLRTKEEILAVRDQGRLYPQLLTDALDVPLIWGQGQQLETLLTPEAYTTIALWIEQTVTVEKNRYRDQEPPLVHQSCIPRLDRHFLQICFAYAAATRQQKIQIEHIEAATWIVSAAQRFTEGLIEDRPITHTFQTQEHMGLDEIILVKAGERPGSTRKEICLRLRRHADFPEIGKRIALLVGAGILHEKPLEGSRKLGLWPVT